MVEGSRAVRGFFTGNAPYGKTTFRITHFLIFALAVTTKFLSCGIWAEARPYSGLMLAARITFAHFSVSSAMNLPKSAGVIDFGTLPMPANCVINLGLDVHVALVRMADFDR